MSANPFSVLTNWNIIYRSKNFKFDDSIHTSYFSLFLLKLSPTPNVNFPKIAYTEQIFIKHMNKQMNKLQLHGNHQFVTGTNQHKPARYSLWANLHFRPFLNSFFK